MLVIEDGSGSNPAAESYATTAELADYAARFGLTVPPDVELQEVLLRRAAQAMNAMSWRGRRVSTSQALAWPRTGVDVDHEVLPSNLIPGPIQYGQMALAAELHHDDLNPPSQQGPVKREKVDVIEVEYFENTGSLTRPAPERPSQIQFRDYLRGRGWYVPAIRA